MGPMLFKKQDQPAKLSDELFAKLSVFLGDRTGLHFNHHKKRLLEDRMQIRLRANGLSAFEEYWHLLADRERRQKELPALYDSVTSWDTRFFRHPEQFDALTAKVLPDVVRTKEKGRTIRVWSAGCSTGDEAYTLAIVLGEALPAYGEDWKLEVVATDLSESALAIAARGRYSRFALRDVPPDKMETYFERVDQNEYFLRNGLKDEVAFRPLNLGNKAMVSTMSEFDVIFCRNVITYFSPDAKERLMDQIAACLRYGGFLFLGQSESLYGVTTTLNRVQFEGALAYKKE
jgi:chemotaxis protein methyltransferase CheR